MVFAGAITIRSRSNRRMSNSSRTLLSSQGECLGANMGQAMPAQPLWNFGSASATPGPLGNLQNLLQSEECLSAIAGQWEPRRIAGVGPRLH